MVASIIFIVVCGTVTSKVDCISYVAVDSVFRAKVVVN